MPGEKVVFIKRQKLWDESVEVEQDGEKFLQFVKVEVRVFYTGAYTLKQSSL